MQNISVMLLRDGLQGLRGGKVWNGIALFISQNIIRHGNKGDFLPKWLAKLVYDGQAIDIRVNDKPHISLIVNNNLTGFADVSGRGSGHEEISGGFTVKANYFVHSKSLQ